MADRGMVAGARREGCRRDEWGDNRIMIIHRPDGGKHGENGRVRPFDNRCHVVTLHIAYRTRNLVFLIDLYLLTTLETPLCSLDVNENVWDLSSGQLDSHKMGQESWTHLDILVVFIIHHDLHQQILCPWCDRFLADILDQLTHSHTHTLSRLTISLALHAFVSAVDVPSWLGRKRTTTSRLPERPSAPRACARSGSNR